VDKESKDTFSCIFAFTKNTPIGKMCPKRGDGFVKSPPAALRFNFVVAAHL